MPIRPGILLSSLLMVACLGMNMALHPEVHEMLREPKATVASAPRPKMAETAEPEKPFYPELDQPQTKIHTEAKSSKVHRPIPIETQPPTAEKTVTEKPKKEKPAEKIEKKAETPPPPPPPVEEKKVVEKPKAEKKPEPKPVEAKPEPKVEPKTEEKHESVNESYGLPSVFPLDSSEPAVQGAPKPELTDEPPKKSGADAFQPLLPSEFEKDYRESEGKNVNQADLPQMGRFPQPDRQPTAPLYAAPFSPETPKPPKEPEPKLKRLPKTETAPKPVESNPVPRKAPKSVWDTPETIMERPIVYE